MVCPVREGEVYTTNSSGDIEIIKRIHAKKILVKFINTGKMKYCASKEIRSGGIKDQFKPSVHGVGYIGEGIHRSCINNKMTPVYNKWEGMLRRCYNKNHKNYPRYGARGVHVCNEWHNLQMFGAWFDENYREGFELDKDILYPDSLCYGPSTCILVPVPLNKLLTFSNAARGSLPVGVTREQNDAGYIATVDTHLQGSLHKGGFISSDDAFEWYKDKREESIKQAAGYYLDKGDICLNTYLALMRYELEQYPK